MLTQFPGAYVRHAASFYKCAMLILKSIVSGVEFLRKLISDCVNREQIFPSNIFHSKLSTLTEMIIELSSQRTLFAMKGRSLSHHMH